MDVAFRRPSASPSSRSTSLPPSSSPLSPSLLCCDPRSHRYRFEPWADDSRSCTITTPVSHGSSFRLPSWVTAASGVGWCLCAASAAHSPAPSWGPTSQTGKRGSQPSWGASLLLPEWLLLGRVGPGQPEMYCVWKRTSPKTRKPSFRAWARARVSCSSGPRDRLPPVQTRPGAVATGPSCLPCSLGRRPSSR